MRLVSSVAAVFVAFALAGCAEDSPADSDDAVSSDEAAVTKGERYTVQGQFVAKHSLAPLKNDPRSWNGKLPPAPVSDPIGPGSISVFVKESFQKQVNLAIPEEVIVADIEIKYPSADGYGTESVVEKNVTLLPVLGGYGPGHHSAKIPSLPSGSITLQFLWSGSPSNLGLYHATVSYDIPDTHAPVDGVPVTTRSSFEGTNFPVKAK